MGLGWFLDFYESESSNFVYTLRVAEHTVGKKLKMLRLIFAFFLHFSFFSISHSIVIHREICVKISQEQLHLGF